MTSAQASIQLELSLNAWWIALQTRNFRRACFAANDIVAAARALSSATYQEANEDDKRIEAARQRSESADKI